MPTNQSPSGGPLPPRVQTIWCLGGGSWKECLVLLGSTKGGFRAVAIYPQDACISCFHSQCCCACALFQTLALPYLRPGWATFHRQGEGLQGGQRHLVKQSLHGSWLGAEPVGWGSQGPPSTLVQEQFLLCLLDPLP